MDAFLAAPAPSVSKPARGEITELGAGRYSYVPTSGETFRQSMEALANVGVAELNGSAHNEIFRHSELTLDPQHKVLIVRATERENPATLARRATDFARNNSTSVVLHYGTGLLRFDGQSQDSVPLARFANDSVNARESPHSTIEFMQTFARGLNAALTSSADNIGGYETLELEVHPDASVWLRPRAAALAETSRNEARALSRLLSGRVQFTTPDGVMKIFQQGGEVQADGTIEWGGG